MQSSDKILTSLTEPLSRLLTDFYNSQNCPHTVTVTQVTHAVVGCETTVTVCCRCKKIIDKPKTDCR